MKTNKCNQCEGFYDSSLCPKRCGDGNNIVVITQHPGLVKYLIKQGIIGTTDEVIAHATRENVEGKDVIGVLPHSLSCLTRTYQEVQLDLPAELRRKELTLEQVQKYSKGLKEYKVEQI